MWFFAGIIASLMIWLDLYSSIHIPPLNVKEKVWPFFLLSVFVLANFGLAVGFYFFFVGTPQFQSFNLPDWLSAVVLGLTYPAFVHLKFAVYKDGATEIPLGVELLYEKSKKALISHLKEVFLDANYQQVNECARSNTLEEIVRRAKYRMDQTLQSPENEAAKQWLLKILQDNNTQEYDKKLALCEFCISGNRFPK